MEAKAALRLLALMARPSTLICCALGTIKRGTSQAATRMLGPMPEAALERAADASARASWTACPREPGTGAWARGSWAANRAG